MAVIDPAAGSFRHPGSGRRRARTEPKGRQVRPEALADIDALLGDRPRRPDLLIEHLHLIQDRFGAIGPDHLAALAHGMRLSYAEVYEVATFYAHFDVLRDGEAVPARVTVRVCDSLSCALAGAEGLLEGLSRELATEIADREVRLVRAPCVGRCAVAPVAEVGHNFIDSASVGDVAQATRAGEVDPVIPEHVTFEEYVERGGYRLLARCLSGEVSPEAVIAALEAAELRGLGGAGFPTGRKWRAVRGEPGPRMMVVNGDEGEPGTFKDRYFLETDSHRFIEGMLIAAWAVEAREAYLYLRDEYPAARHLIERQIQKVIDAGICPDITILMRRGAGAYICGEESALLESIEGKRGLPRHKPPYPFQKGLFGRPTLMNNVETLYWIRDIVERGPDWWNGQGRHGRRGARAFSISGRVAKPGVVLAPAGITLNELIHEFCGGMAAGHQLKAFLPGGASGGILPASLADVPLDFGTLEPHGSFLGSAAVIVLSDQDDLGAVARNLMRFFEDESCGQCTPCRVGTQKAVSLMAAPRWDGALMTELAGVMRDASICGLGQAASNPLTSVLKYFGDEVAMADGVPAPPQGPVPRGITRPESVSPNEDLTPQGSAS